MHKIFLRNVRYTQKFSKFYYTYQRDSVLLHFTKCVCVTANLNENAYKFDARSNLRLGFPNNTITIFSAKKIWYTRYVNTRSTPVKGVVFYPFKDLRALFSGTCTACNYLTDQRSRLVRDISEFLGNQNVIFVVFYTEILFFLFTAYTYNVILVITRMHDAN